MCPSQACRTSIDPTIKQVLDGFISGSREKHIICHLFILFLGYIFISVSLLLGAKFSFSTKQKTRGCWSRHDFTVFHSVNQEIGFTQWFGMNISLKLYNKWLRECLGKDFDNFSYIFKNGIVFNLIRNIQHYRAHTPVCPFHGLGTFGFFDSDDDQDCKQKNHENQRDSRS